MPLDLRFISWTHPYLCQALENETLYHSCGDQTFVSDWRDVLELPPARLSKVWTTGKEGELWKKRDSDSFPIDKTAQDDLKSH
jgi:hypothetical protein